MIIVMVNIMYQLTGLRDSHIAGKNIASGCVCEDVSRKDQHLDQ